MPAFLEPADIRSPRLAEGYLDNADNCEDIHHK